MDSEAPVESLEAPTQNSSPQQLALNRFSDALFAVQDKLTEGEYLALNNAAKELYDAKRSPPHDTHWQLSATMNEAREMLNSRMHLHIEIDSYRSQLTSATVTIDSLRKRRDEYAKRLQVVESLCMRLGGSVKTMDTEFELYGLKPQSEFEADRRRRRSASPLAEGGTGDDEEDAPQQVQELSSSDEEDDEEVLLFPEDPGPRAVMLG